MRKNNTIIDNIKIKSRCYICNVTYHYLFIFISISVEKEIQTFVLRTLDIYLLQTTQYIAQA